MTHAEDPPNRPHRSTGESRDVVESRDAAEGSDDAGSRTEAGPGASDATVDGEAASSPTVHELDDATVEKIAAGEVVTRPASVVRELVENALDAGASRVDVEVAGDGTERIRVADDGRGMSGADARRAVRRHTTSKISGAADVDRVETLGFRGEALPSIASVADLELVTNTGGARGTRVRVDDGEPATEPAGRARGTTVVVRDLFHNRPARRKSLASAKAEFARISDLVARYALAHPGVRFSLSHDGGETFSTPGSGDYVDAVLGVYDRTVASRSTAFEHVASPAGGDGAEGDDATDEAGGDDIRVGGLLAYPSVTRAKRDHVYVAVNGRPVADERLRAAVVAGYGSLLPDGRAPVAVVSVEVAPGAVDHNVHPAKAEVAFRDADAVESAVETGVRDALATADLRRSAEVAMDLDSSLRPVTGDSSFEDVSVIGSFRDLYLLCEADGDLLVVDQHAAHERINYERLRAALADEGVPTAPLDPPETVPLSPAGAATVEAERGTLADLGFDIAPFGGDVVRVSGVPAPLGRVADADALRDVVDALAAGDRPADLREEVLADLACHPSLKAGDALSAEAAADLVERLGECDRPYACPHGRPTVLSIDEETFVRGFERGATRLD